MSFYRMHLSSYTLRLHDVFCGILFYTKGHIPLIMISFQQVPGILSLVLQPQLFWQHVSSFFIILCGLKLIENSMNTFFKYSGLHSHLVCYAGG